MTEAAPGTVARVIAVLLLVAALIGLGLQAWLFVARDGIALGPWRQAGYFTVWSNVAAAVLAVATVRAPGSALAGPRMRLLVATALVTVWLGYGESLHWRGGAIDLSWLVSAILHDETPLLALLLFAVRPHGKLDVRSLGIALLFPALFLLVALVRRASEGWVPYGFLNAPAGVPLAGTIATVMLLFAAVGGVLMLLDRLLGRYASRASERT